MDLNKQVLMGASENVWIVTQPLGDVLVREFGSQEPRRIVVAEIVEPADLNRGLLDVVGVAGSLKSIGSVGKPLAFFVEEAVVRRQDAEKRFPKQIGEL